MKLKIVSVFFFVFFHGVAFCNELTIKKLAGEISKTWTFEAFDVSLGGGVSCSEGKRYTFRPDGSLLIEECIAGRIEENGTTFSISKDGIDVFLYFLGSRHRAIYSKRINFLGAEQEELVLRIEASKSEETKDLILSRMP